MITLLVTHSRLDLAQLCLLIMKDGNVRFCIDYKAVNDCAKKQSFSLPQINNSLDQLSGCKYSTTLDLKSGFWQILIVFEKTAFTCHQRIFDFNVMPLGLSNAPATIQHLMRIVLDKVE